MTELLHQLKTLGISPQKRLGQNFLIDQEIHATIVKAAAIEKQDTVIEIGAGTGFLTNLLAATGARIIALEKDEKLVPILTQALASYKNVTIEAQDVLQYRPVAQKYKVVGNIPYYLTSHLIRVVFEKWPRPELLLFMVQQEVAKQITAQAPHMNLLALSVQYYAKPPRLLQKVSREAFWPQPDVDSALIKIIPRNTPDTPAFTEAFFAIAHAGFAQKRKQLLNSLSANLKLEKNLLLSYFKQADIAPERRPESLALYEWLKLTQLLALVL